MQACFVRRCIHRYAARMCWVCTNSLTQHGNEWVSWAKSTRRKKGGQISLQGDMQLKTPSMVFKPPPLPPPSRSPPPSSFKALTLWFSCGLRTLLRWCTVVYWSPESQMALVSAGRVLEDFINKPSLVRDTDGCWPERLLYVHLTSYKKKKKKRGGEWLEISLHIYHLSSPGLFITHFPCQMLLHLI